MMIPESAPCATPTLPTSEDGPIVGAEKGAEKKGAEKGSAYIYLYPPQPKFEGGMSGDMLVPGHAVPGHAGVHGPPVTGRSTASSALGGKIGPSSHNPEYPTGCVVACF